MTLKCRAKGLSRAPDQQASILNRVARVLTNLKCERNGIYPLIYMMSGIGKHCLLRNIIFLIISMHLT